MHLRSWTMLEKLVRIFNANSSRHLLIIFLVFAITGSLSVYVSGPILMVLELDKIISIKPLYWIVRVAVITIAYQLSLLVVASLFGQFSYFLKVQRKFLHRFYLFKKN